MSFKSTAIKAFNKANTITKLAYQYIKFCICFKHLPFSTFIRMKKIHSEYNIDYNALMSLNLLSKPNNYYDNNEYLERCAEINSWEARDLLSNKTILYKRCPQLLGRDVLILSEADTDDIREFIKRNPIFVGKRNYGKCGERFSVYDASSMSAEELITTIHNNKQKLLEGYIVQHHDIAKIYPFSVNTLRIHTVNNGNEIRSYLKPKMRFGCNGSVIDANGKESYRAVLNLDGTVDMAAKIDKCGLISKAILHDNTGVVFDDVHIPFVPEAVSLAITAAAYFPEAGFIGWDIAITEAGPVIVEGNAISGCFSTYQTINYLYHGCGLKNEIDEMLSFAENV